MNADTENLPVSELNSDDEIRPSGVSVSALFDAWVRQLVVLGYDELDIRLLLEAVRAEGGVKAAKAKVAHLKSMAAYDRLMSVEIPS